jgi:GxxExxY protein
MKLEEAGKKKNIKIQCLYLGLAGLQVQRELYSPLTFKGHIVGKNFFDFLVNESVVVELKTSDRFLKPHFEQLENYLVNARLKLGLLISFGRHEVKFKRILNTELLNAERESQRQQNS